MRNINRLEFKCLIPTGITILDIRDKNSYNQYHLVNSINIPFSNLFSCYKKLSKDITYYVICYEGITSYKACLFLESYGYHTVNVLGGMKNFK